jgi:3-hydroxyisobutyrate dehydrogenase-like beta-hydroxyacid dehydrogenase
MTAKSIGVLHPGAMGSSVAVAAKGNGHTVRWASVGRRQQTVQRARDAGLTGVSSLADLVAASDIILSVCPPHAALEVASEVAALRFGGTFVDCNAVSPARAREAEAVVMAGGARFVDGGIVGPPAWRPGSTRLYLSGEGATEVAALFDGSPLSAIVIDGPAGAASALKMCYAAYTKGTTALLAAILAVAGREGVGQPLTEEWARSQPDLASYSAARVQSSTAKAWRFVGEMEEIAATFEQAGVPGGFHQAAAEIYSRLAGFKDNADLPPMESVLDALLSPSDAVAR